MVYWYALFISFIDMIFNSSLAMNDDMNNMSFGSSLTNDIMMLILLRML